MAKSKWVKKVTAGRLVHAVCYNRPAVNDDRKARSEKSKLSSLARKWMNFRTSWQRCQLMVAANFCKGDLYVSLSYDDEHLPKNRAEHNKNMNKFIRVLRESRAASGDVLKYLYSTHELLDDGGRRLHVHMVINAGRGKDDFDVIRSLWPYGSNIGIQRVSETEYYSQDDFEDLAKYLCREKRPDAPPLSVGKRGWTGSKNLARPVETSGWLEDDMTIDFPVGVTPLDKYETRNDYGSFIYLKYLLPDKPLRPPRAAKAPAGKAAKGAPGKAAKGAPGKAAKGAPG